MNCREVGTRIQALADDQIGPADRRAVEEHLTGCPKCAQAAREARQNVTFLIDRLAHLRGAGRIDLSNLVAPAPAPTRSVTGATGESKRRPLLLIAIAVLIVLAVVAFFVFRGGEDEKLTDLGRATNAAERDRPKRTAAPPPASVAPETTAQPAADIPREPTGDTSRPPKTTAPVPISVAAMLPVLKRRPTQRNLERAWAALAADPNYSTRLITRIGSTEGASFRTVLVLVLGADNRTPQTRAELFRILGEDGAPQVRAAAAASLARSAGEEAELIPVLDGLLAVPVGAIDHRPTLKQLLAAAEAERDPAVVATLIRAVGPSEGPEGAISARLVELAYSESEVVRDAALKALIASPPSDSQVLLRMIEDPSLPIESRAELVHGLSQGRAAVNQLSAIIRTSGEVPVQVAAVEALGTCWDKYARIEILETLHSAATPAVRRAAISVLASNPTPGSVKVLKQIARNDPDRGIRQDAARAAKEMGRAIGASKKGAGSGR